MKKQIALPILGIVAVGLSQSLGISASAADSVPHKQQFNADYPDPAIRASTTPVPDKPSVDVKLNPAVFQVLDNMAWRPTKINPDPNTHKPDTSLLGMVHCNIVYISPSPKKAGHYTLPDEQAFKANVRRNSVLPGPIVLDVEWLYLKGSTADEYIDILLTLVRWTREVAPNRIVGYYGHGIFPNPPDDQHMAKAKELAEAVDAFFPSLYEYNGVNTTWKGRVETMIKTAHDMDPTKPVYIYLWRMHNDPVTDDYQVLSGDDWRYQLETVKASGANGVVLWGGVFTDWPVQQGWWQATLQFMEELKK